jgi:RimJ/RimL family protein N-acetyltransferase
MSPRIETERLILRPLEDADRAPLAALNADPEVMRWFPARLTRAESDAQFDRLRERAAKTGVCFQAVEAKGGPRFAGFVGLSHVDFTPFDPPTVEIGWRLAPAAWGKGWATEAARAWLAYGFGEMGLGEIVSFTVPDNVRSRAVMERLGMRRDPGGDFEMPTIPPGHPLRRHVLYRLSAEDWRAAVARGAATDQSAADRYPSAGRRR